MTGANLALLGFIMAFSFSQAADHHSNRKRLILAEANAIGTASLRAGLVDPAQGKPIRALLADYLAVRITVTSQEDFDPAKMIADSLELQVLMWEQVEELSRAGPADEIDALLIEAINDVFDIHESRVTAGMRNRLPESLWVALMVLLTLSMLGIGHFSGLKGRRNPIASTALALSFSMVFFLIADLDRPLKGLVRSDQSAMLELSERL
jgi:acyl carrier protein